MGDFDNCFCRNALIVGLLGCDFNLGTQCIDFLGYRLLIQVIRVFAGITFFNSGSVRPKFGLVRFN